MIERTVTKRKCTARCWYAKSKTCHCKCRGQNHGKQRSVLDSYSPESQTKVKQLMLDFSKWIAKSEFFTEKRLRSPEIDFGVWWRNGKEYPTFRVSYIKDTGEFYAINNQTKTVSLLGKIKPTDSYEEAEHVLKSWSEECGGMYSLDWVRNKIDIYNK